jgi:anti-anti-sigma regulatory factor
MKLGAHPKQAPSRTDRRGQFPWLSVDGSDEDAVWVRVSGGAAAGRSEELWNALEAALEQAVLGRAVIIDLTGVSVFDVNTIATLSIISRQATRWHLDLHAIVEPSSPLAQYVHGSGLDQVLATHSTTDAVRASLRAGIEANRTTSVGSALMDWRL